MLLSCCRRRDRDKGRCHVYLLPVARGEKVGKM